MRVAAVIPARFSSSRLPGKPLSEIHGKPMIQHVYERTSKAAGIDSVWVATDDERILKAVQAFGGKAIMTGTDIASGTDRIAAAAAQVPADIYVNVQGDEPLIDPKAIEKAVDLVRSGRFMMSTIMTPIRDASDLDNPAVVKVVTDQADRAIYFSRFGIPYSRTAPPKTGFVCRRHVGLYCYTRDTLLKLTQLPQSKLEQGESLEQLRALENGIAIGIAEVDFVSIGVDTPEELEKVRNHLWQSRENTSL